MKNNNHKISQEREYINNLIGKPTPVYELVNALKCIFLLLIFLQIILFICYLVEISEIINNVKKICDSSNIKINLKNFIDTLASEYPVSVSVARLFIDGLINVSFFVAEIIGFLICRKYIINNMHKEFDTFEKNTK